MNIKDIMALSSLKPDFKGEIHGFLTLCEQLEKLTIAETEALMSLEGLQDRRMTYKKLSLLEGFESKASEIFERIKSDAPDNLALQNHLIDRVKSFQSQLKVNTGLHLHMMSKNPHYSGEGATQCH